MADGVSFEEIKNYVRENLRITEANAALRVAEVLASGVALGKIIKTVNGRYRLIERKPPGLVCKIQDMRTSDDSAEEEDNSELEDEYLQGSDDVFE